MPVSCRVEPEQPRPVEQEAARVAVGVQRPLRRAVGAARAAGAARRSAGEGEQAEQQASHHGDCQHRARRQSRGGRSARRRREAIGSGQREQLDARRRSAGPRGARARTARRAGRVPARQATRPEPARRVSESCALGR